MQASGLVFSRIHVNSKSQKLPPIDSKYSFRLNSIHNEVRKIVLYFWFQLLKSKEKIFIFKTLITSIIHMNEQKAKHSRDKPVNSRNNLSPTKVFLSLKIVYNLI